MSQFKVETSAYMVQETDTSRDLNLLFIACPGLTVEVYEHLDLRLVRFAFNLRGSGSHTIAMPRSSR